MPTKLRSSRSITLLAVVAVGTWAAVWWLERERSAAGRATVVAGAGGVDGESVTR